MKSAKALKVFALIPPAITLVILLFFVIGESVGGDSRGLGHLILVIPIGLMMSLSWKRPPWGGVLFLVKGFGSLRWKKSGQF